MAQLACVVHRDQGDELLAAQAHQQVIRAQRRAHAPRAFPQHLVAAGVAEPVVDLFEVVEIAIDQAQAQAGAGGAGQFAGEELVEGGAVPQLGQRVDQRLALFAVHGLAQLCACWLTLRSCR